jgi:hypothetical protein
VSRHLTHKLLALAGVACLMLAQFCANTQRPDFSDFKVYWLAGAKAVAHHTVYDVEGHYQYKYSPFVALIWGIPHLLGGSRYFWALAHYAACATGFLALWFVCARLLDRERSIWLWLIALVSFSIGLRDELKLGQANLWPLLLVLPAWLSGSRAQADKRSLLAGLAIGAAWGFAIQWKLYALVLGPVWLLRRRWDVFAGAFLFTLASLGLGLALAHGADFTWAENARWLRSLSASSEELLISQYNVSALGVFGKWGLATGIHFGAWAYLLWLVLAMAWGLVLVWAERCARLRASAYLVFWSTSWAWAGIVLLNPLVWPYWLTFCVPLYLAYLLEHYRKAGFRPDALLVVSIGVFLLANWLQNTAVVHAGLSFVAVTLLLFDAQRRARGRGDEALPPFSPLRSDVVVPVVPSPRASESH